MLALNAAARRLDGGGRDGLGEVGERLLALEAGVLDDTGVCRYGEGNRSAAVLVVWTRRSQLGARQHKPLRRRASKLTCSASEALERGTGGLDSRMRSSPASEEKLPDQETKVEPSRGPEVMG